MTSASHEKRPVPARCDLCGREAMPGKPYTLLSQVVTRPEKKVSLEPTDTAPLRSEAGFKSHDFVVCSRCHGRKFVFLGAALVMTGAWIGLAMRSKGPGPFLIGALVLVAFMFASGPFLPVQRLARRIKKERRRAFASAHPGVRFYVKTLTPAALPYHQKAPAAGINVKKCTACHREVPLTSKAGDFCPHCGVLWGSETEECGSCGAQVPLPRRVEDPCPRCGARRSR